MIFVAVIGIGLSSIVVKDRIQVLVSSDNHSATIVECKGKAPRKARSRGRSSSWNYAPVAVSKEGYKAVGTKFVSGKSFCQSLIGRKTTILVNRSDPTDARINSFFQFWLFPTAILFALCFIALLKRPRAGIAIFAGFFAFAGGAVALEFGLFNDRPDTALVSPVDSTLALDACIQHAMGIEGVHSEGALKQLVCADRGLTDLERVFSLSALEELDLRSNNIESLAPLKSLLKLRELKLDGSRQITSLDGLETLIVLEVLSARSMQIDDIDALRMMTNLRKIDLNYNRLSDISALEELDQLERISIGDNPDITDISALAGKPLLTSLGMYRTTLSDISALYGNEALRLVNIGSSGTVPCSQISELRIRLKKSARVRGPKDCG